MIEIPNYVLTGTRGGPNRARILHALDERPRNANQIAEHTDLHYKTVRHHLDVLVENGVVRCHGAGDGAVYLPTDKANHHWDEIREMLPTVE